VRAEVEQGNPLGQQRIAPESPAPAEPDLDRE
jgi:hypothetical protein